MPTFPTPEEAARAVVGDKFDRLVGVVVRGDEAVVAQWVKAGHPNYADDTETTTCYRSAEGWEAGSTGNGNAGTIQTAEDRMTYVWWDQAPPDAAAVRVAIGDQEKTVAIDHGFFFAVFDDVPYHDPPQLRGYTLTPEDRPRLAGWEQPQVREWVFADNEPPA